MLSRRRFLQVSATLTATAFCSALPRLSHAEETFESRAIFDEGLNWMNPKTAHSLCRRIKRAGFNVFMPCVWHGRGTVWPSELAPWDSNNIHNPDYDPLANLVDIAREYEIEVHPWITVGLRQRNFLPEFVDSPKSESFDWHNPAFRNFAVSLIMEVVNRYAIQGINLDFVRFSSPRPGHELEQEAVVADVIRRVSNQIRNIKPELVISVCAAPWHKTIGQFGQNSPKWADEGIIDVIYSMQYEYNPDFEVVKQIQSRMKNPQALVMMIGNYDQSKLTGAVLPRDAKRVCDLLAESRKLSLKNGVGLYLYSMLSDEQIDLLRHTTFRDIARSSWERRLRVPTNVTVQ